MFPYKNGGFTIPKDKEEDVASIRAWLKHQPYLPEISDDFIHQFLHSNYYSIEKAKTTIDSYFTIRAENKEIVTWDPQALDHVFTLYEQAPLAKTTPEGYKILFYRLRDTDPSKFIFPEALKAFMAFNDVRISEDGPVPGYVVVFDMKGTTMGHLARASTYMSYIKAFMLYIQEAHPVRLKGVHAINSTWFADKIISLIKPFLQSDLMQLIHFHSSLDSLEPFIPLSLLPEEYGGDAKPLSLLHDEHCKMMKREYPNWLTEVKNLIADLDKKPQKSKQEVMQGSFRSLSID